ncbi:hypothetical protein B0E53_06987 [Micromonospora sp. MH33]|nr:hypothetical protein B0E53_06987 [Micromonospora sp. MH33]
MARSKECPAPAASMPASSASASAAPVRSTTGTATSVGSSRTAYGTPPVCGIRQRSTSCRSATARSAAPSAVVSSGPRSRCATAMLYGALDGASWSMNQSRRCGGESVGGLPVVSPSPSAGAAARTRSTSAAKVRSVNSTWVSTRRPSSARSAATSRMAAMELPPAARKSLSGPGLAPSSRAQSRRTAASTGSPPATSSASRGAATASARSAGRSSLPLVGLTGSAASRTVRAGSIAVVSRGPAYARSVSSSGASAGVRKATSSVPAGPGTASTATRSTPGCPASTASTSPSSIRWPRTLTCRSARPR